MFNQRWVHTIFNSQHDAAWSSVFPAIQANSYQAGVYPVISFWSFGKPHVAFFVHRDGLPLPLNRAAVLHTETHAVVIFHSARDVLEPQDRNQKTVSHANRANDLTHVYPWCAQEGAYLHWSSQDMAQKS